MYPTSIHVVNVLMSDPAIGAPRLLPSVLKTVFNDVASPISLGSTVSTRRLAVDTIRVAMPAANTIIGTIIDCVLGVMAARRNPTLPMIEPATLSRSEEHT